jgi:hypothetical protein
MCLTPIKQKLMGGFRSADVQVTRSIMLFSITVVALKLDGLDYTLTITQSDDFDR